MKNRKKIIISLGLFLSLGISILFISKNSNQGSRAQLEVLHTVQKGPLSVTVTESGTIANREEVRIKSKVFGRKTILFLIDEGALVQKGDLLVELDSSGLVDELEQGSIQAENSEASYIQEREQLEITKNRTLSEIEKSKQHLKFAKMDLENYLSGQYPQKLQEAKNNITLAAEELKRSEDKLEWSDKLGDEGFVTRSELEGDRLEVKRRKLNLEVVKSKLNLLEKFTYIRDKELLESDVYQAEQALIRTKKNANADMIRAEASLRAKESEFKRQSKKKDEIKDQIEKCKIVAPQDGMVIYATSVNKSRWNNKEPLQVGQEVRERQDLIYLPTNSGMKADIKIHETDLQVVKLGMPVQITVDALNGLKVAGRVVKIAPLPDQSSLWMNPDLKVYETEIYLDDRIQGLRTGMNCRAEILIKHYDNIPYIPVQSVVKIDENPTVFIKNGSSVEQRVLECGYSNNRMLAVTSGLKEGDLIQLNPPLEFGELPPSSFNQNRSVALDIDVIEQAKTMEVSKKTAPNPLKSERMQKFKNWTPEQKKAFREKMEKTQFKSQ